MTNKNNGLIIALTTIAFISIAIISCTKNPSPKPQISKIESELPFGIRIRFTWEEWGHHEDVKDLDGNVVSSHCPGAGLCNFKIVRGGASLTSNLSADLEEDENGFYIKAIIDESFPMDQIDNFQITNDITEYDEDGLGYTIRKGVYQFNTDLNGYRLPVIIN